MFKCTSFLITVYKNHDKKFKHWNNLGSLGASGQNEAASQALENAVILKICQHSNDLFHVFIYI
jgi:hypothetical protein